MRCFRLLLIVAVIIIFSSLVLAMSGGNGNTEGTAWIIEDCNDTQDIGTGSYELSDYYKLNSDIDCSDTVNWNSGSGFDPIASSGSPFTGTLDGQGNVITDLYMSRTMSRMGMFEVISAATIKKLGIEDAQILGPLGSNDYFGILAGETTGAVLIDQVYVTGYVRGRRRTGGLVGRHGGGGDINNSYSRAVVNSSTWAGGIAGRQVSQATAEFYDSYATGTVVGTLAAGLSYDGGTSSNCFYDTETTGQSTDGSGATGKTSAQMKTESTFTDAGWDFTNIWAIDAGINDGYPYLQVFQSAGSGDLTANLTLSDSTGGSSVLNGTSIDFFAAYVNASSGAFISGASCNISFDDDPGTWSAMTEDASNNRYNYTKSDGFSSAGSHSWNVTCIKSGFDHLNGSDTVQVILPSPFGGVKSNVSSITYDATKGANPSIARVSIDLYAVAYRGDLAGNDKVRVKTLNITEDGLINGVIGSIEVGVGGSTNGDTNIVHLVDDIYVLAFRDDLDDCHLRTLNISSNGSISEIDSYLAFEDDCNTEPVMVNISSSIVAMVFKTTGSHDIGANEPFVYTLKIFPNGTIEDAVKDKHRLTGETCQNSPSIAHFSDNYFLVAYDKSDGNSYVETVQIDGTTGAVSSVDTEMLQSSSQVDPGGIICVDDICSVTFDRTDTNAGWVKTFEINDSNGNIVDLKDSKEFNSTGRNPDIVYLGSDIFAIPFYGANNDGWISTIAIDALGNIGDVIEAFEFDGADGNHPDIVFIKDGSSSDSLALVGYTGTGSSGKIQTIEFETSMDLPYDSTFGSGTTDFSAESDLARVNGMKLAKSGGSVTWDGPVNVGSEDYDSNIAIGTGFVSLNVDSLHATINTSASVSLTVDGCDNLTLYHAEGFHSSLGAIMGNGTVCNATTDPACTNINCAGSTVTFDVPHFDSFGGEGGGGGTEIPEFSDYAIMMIMIISVCGFLYVRRRNI